MRVCVCVCVCACVCVCMYVCVRVSVLLLLFTAPPFRRLHHVKGFVFKLRLELNTILGTRYRAKEKSLKSGPYHCVLVFKIEMHLAFWRAKHHIRGPILRERKNR